jgi:hypothetical protein
MLEEHIDFISESDCVGRVVDKLNGHIDAQEVQIKQLANMVNDLWEDRRTGQENQGIELDHEGHHKVINTLTHKIIALEQCVEDVQKKVFPKVGGRVKLIGY